MPDMHTQRSAQSAPSAHGVAVSLVSRCTETGVTLATAESLTAGLVAATVATVPGASAVLRGGLIVYATELKHELAGVDADLLAARGPVDPEVAAQLARGAAVRCGADLGVGVTGVAGPDPQNGHPVGEVWIGVWGPGLDGGVPRVTALDDGWQATDRSSHGDHLGVVGGANADVRTAIREHAVLRALEALHRATVGLC